MIFNMMNYGGGSVEDAYAVVSVTYPAGSTCKCIKDDESYEMEAANTIGKAMFALPESGRWRLTCTDGTNTAIDYVTPEQYGVYEVTLAYSVSPGPDPQPTPKVTQIVATGIMIGAINATALNGDWNGGDPVIGTSATYTIPELGTYIVVYVPVDQSGARTYFVDASIEGATYNLNLQTGTVTVSQDEDEGSEVTQTVLTVTFPSGTVSITGNNYADSANGSNETNTATFTLETGKTYQAVYSGSKGIESQTITARGETATIRFVGQGESECNLAVTYPAGSIDVSANGLPFDSCSGSGETNIYTFAGLTENTEYTLEYTRSKQVVATKTYTAVPGTGVISFMDSAE